MAVATHWSCTAASPREHAETQVAPSNHRFSGVEARNIHFSKVLPKILNPSQAELRAKFYGYRLFLRCLISDVWVHSFHLLWQLPLNMSWDDFYFPNVSHSHSMRIPSPITLPLGRLCSSHSAREPSEQGTLSDSVFSTVSRTLAQISVKNNRRHRMSPSYTKNSFNAGMSGFRPTVTTQMCSNIAFLSFHSKVSLPLETPTLVKTENLEHGLREGNSPSMQGSAF